MSVQNCNNLVIWQVHRHLSLPTNMLLFLPVPHRKSRGCHLFIYILAYEDGFPNSIQLFATHIRVEDIGDLCRLIWYYMTHLLNFVGLNPEYSGTTRSMTCLRRQTIRKYGIQHDDVIKFKHFPRYWPFVREIHWDPVNCKGQRRGDLMFSLICV